MWCTVKTVSRLGLVAHTRNLSTWVAGNFREGGGEAVQGHPWLYCEFRAGLGPQNPVSGKIAIVIAAALTGPQAATLMQP